MPGRVTLFRSNATEALAIALCRQIADHAPEDPMQPVVVVVGSRGMERWLRNRVATELGVSANIDFRFPRQVLDALLVHALGEAPVALDAWSLEVVAAAVLAELAGDASDLGPLARHQRAPGAPIDRQARVLAGAMADTLDRYIVARPEWALAWGAGRGRAPSGPDADWQGALFRRLVARLGDQHFASRVAALQARAGRLGPLPFERLHLFGLTTIAPAFLQVLAAVSSAVALSLYLPCPSDKWWADLQSAGELARARKRGQAAEVARARREQSPLLTALGRSARDLHVVLERELHGYDDAPIFLDPAKLSVRGSSRTLLHTTQRDILELIAPADLGPFDGIERLALASDGSIAVHACFGRLRQVEALREVLLDLFEADETLTPRDVLVMTPDVETFAPLVLAALGAGVDHPARGVADAARWGPSGGPRLPVAVSDLSQRHANPLADLVLRLLELTATRLTAAEVLELVAREPVRARFGIGESDLAMLADWLTQAGVRWGVDAADRARWGLPDDAQNTWGFGLDRLALGAVMPDTGALVDGVAPFDDIEGQAIEQVGRFTWMLDVLLDVLDGLRRPCGLAAWADRVFAALDRLIDPSITSVAAYDQVLGVLDDLRREAALAELTDPLTTAALLDLLSGRLDAGTGGDRLVTGAITLCALAPMRSVPFRVVCLLGMDDGAFPRQPTPRAWDLLLRDRRAGDRDVRDEDRNLLLEAVLAARDRLLVFYAGFDAVSGKPRPPCAPVQELLEGIDALCAVQAPEPSLSARLCVAHPMQPFTAEAFRAPCPPRSPLMYGAAVASLGVRLPRAPVAADVTLPDELERLTWSPAKLARALVKPEEALLQGRLGVYLTPQLAAVETREPVFVEGDDWFGALRVLEAAIHAALDEGAPLDADWVYAQTRARGVVPLGAAGQAWLAQPIASASALVDAYGALSGARASSYAVDLSLPSGRLVGTVGGARGDRLVRSALWSPTPKLRHAMAAWVELLAVACAGAPVTEAWIGGRDATLVLRVPDEPAAVLDALVGAAVEARVRVPCLPARCGEAAAEVPAESEARLANVRRAWKPDERTAPMRAVWGDANPAFDERGQLRPEAEALVDIVWAPLAAHAVPWSHTEVADG